MRRMITSIEIWNKIASISCNWKLYQGNVERTFRMDDLEWRKSFDSKCGKVSWFRDNFFSIARHHLYLKYWQRNNERCRRKLREATKGVYKAKMTAKKLDFRQEQCFRSCFSRVIESLLFQQGWWVPTLKPKNISPARQCSTVEGMEWTDNFVQHDGNRWAGAATLYIPSPGLKLPDRWPQFL